MSSQPPSPPGGPQPDVHAYRTKGADQLSYAPASARNREPIATVLESLLPAQGRVLEIASGTGEHAIFFANRFPEVQWQPSDIEPAALASIATWIEHTQVENVRAPLRIDVQAENWELKRAREATPTEPVAAFDALLNINMIHISPWTACEGLLRGAARILSPGGRLILYGPFQRGGRHTAPSNEAFDRSLRERNPRWGVRDLDRIAILAKTVGLGLERTFEMPANNLMVTFSLNLKAL